MAINFGEFLPSILQSFQGLTMMSQGADLASEGSAYAASSFRTAGSLGITGAQYKADTFRRAGDIAMSGAAYEKKAIENAKKISTKGAEYQAATLINAGNSAVAIARYNKSLDEVETDSTLDVMGRQIKATFASNRAIMAGSGVSLTSKSYLSVMNDAMSTYETQANGIKSSAILRQQQMLREGQFEGIQYLNAANATIYQGRVAEYNFDRQMETVDYQARIAKYNYENQATAAEFEGQVDAWRYEVQARQAEYQGEIAQYQAGVSQAQAIGGMIGKVGSLF